MNKNRWIWLAGGLCLFLLIAAGLFLLEDSGEGDAPLPAGQEKETAEPDKKLTGIHLNIYSLEGEKVMELKADSGEIYGEGAVLSGVEGWYFSDNGGKWSFTAPGARWQSKTGLLEVEGPYTLNRRELSVTGGELSWERDKDVLEGRGGVVLSGKQFILRGEHFIAPSSLRSITVFGKPARLNVEEEEELVVNSPEIEVELE